MNTNLITKIVIVLTTLSLSLLSTYVKDPIFGPWGTPMVVIILAVIATIITEFVGSLLEHDES